MSINLQDFLLNFAFYIIAIPCFLFFFLLNYTYILCGRCEMADTHGSGPCEETRAGSTPVVRTKLFYVYL